MKALESKTAGQFGTTRIRERHTRITQKGVFVAVRFSVIRAFSCVLARHELGNGLN